jgi:hypothetical protein
VCMRGLQLRDRRTGSPGFTLSNFTRHAAVDRAGRMHDGATISTGEE